MTYEHSLAGALGTLYIFYDFSRNLQLRGSTGAAGCDGYIGKPLRYQAFLLAIEGYLTKFAKSHA